MLRKALRSDIDDDNDDDNDDDVKEGDEYDYDDEGDYDLEEFMTITAIKSSKNSSGDNNDNDNNTNEDFIFEDITFSATNELQQQQQDALLEAAAEVYENRKLGLNMGVVDALAATTATAINVAFEEHRYQYNLPVIPIQIQNIVKKKINIKNENNKYIPSIAWIARQLAVTCPSGVFRHNGFAEQFRKSRSAA
jgi:hypothetical protein